jgi:cell division septum initiation protein DivIVA
VPEVAQVDFPIVLRGYDRMAVDEYVRRTSQLVGELKAGRSPQAAVRRALEQVGEEVAGILQRAHETAEQITSSSRREAEDRLEAARREAEAIMTNARHQAEATVSGAQHALTELDAETDRIWAERNQIVEDTRSLSAQLLALAEAAVERFPAAEGPRTDEHPVEHMDETQEHSLAPGDHEPHGDHQVAHDHDDAHAEHDTGELTDGTQSTEPFDIESEAPLPGGEEVTQALSIEQLKPPHDDDDLLAHDAE